MASKLIALAELESAAQAVATEFPGRLFQLDDDTSAVFLAGYLQEAGRLAVPFDAYLAALDAFRAATRSQPRVLKALLGHEVQDFLDAAGVAFSDRVANYRAYLRNQLREYAATLPSNSPPVALPVPSGQPPLQPPPPLAAPQAPATPTGAAEPPPQLRRQDVLFRVPHAEWKLAVEMAALRKPLPGVSIGQDLQVRWSAPPVDANMEVELYVGLINAQGGPCLVGVAHRRLPAGHRLIGTTKPFHGLQEAVPLEAAEVGVVYMLRFEAY